MLFDQMRTRAGDVDLDDVIAYLKKQPDWNPLKQGTQLGPYRRTDNKGAVVKRLEDIDVSWLEKYVNNMLVGYKIHSGEGTLKSYRNSNQVMVEYRDEEGGVITAADFLTDDDNTAGSPVLEAKAKLPYLLKRLHQKSKELHTSLISMLGAYMKTMYYANNGHMPKPGDLLGGSSAPIWQMDDSGHLTHPFPQSANHNATYPRAFAFISGANPADPYYKDVKDMMNVCDTLGIHLWDEDPHQFDEEFINSLTVDYIVKNHDFFNRNPAVLSNLKTAKISDYHAAAELSEINIVNSRNLIQMLLSTTDLTVTHCLRGTVSAELMNRFLLTMAAQNPNLLMTVREYRRATGHLPSIKGNPDTKVWPTIDAMESIDGFLCRYDSTVPYVFDVSQFCDTRTNKAILHISGNLFMMTEDDGTFVLSVEDALEYIAHIRATHNRPYSVPMSGNLVFGKWKYCKL